MRTSLLCSRDCHMLTDKTTEFSNLNLPCPQATDWEGTTSIRTQQDTNEKLATHVLHELHERGWGVLESVLDNILLVG